LETTLRFVKYHGLGNDFIVLVPPPETGYALTPDVAILLCRRGFSIGADGVMLVSPPSDGVAADVRMDLINSDGSLPEMCGNGIRCLVKHAVDRMGQRANPLRVETPAGVLDCYWTLHPTEAGGPDDPGSRGVATVKVAMGRPRFTLDEVPVATDHLIVAPPFVVVPLGDRRIDGVPVNTGNPHFVVFGDASRERALADGPPLELNPAFPSRANIEFTEVVEDNHLRVTVWERGCGLTFACGTGATAATAAAIRAGFISGRGPVAVDLPGGRLAITVDPDFAAAWMEGPAELAFEGDVSLP
jgi:diaminopimelate epimerase